MVSLTLGREGWVLHLHDSYLVDVFLYRFMGMLINCYTFFLLAPVPSSLYLNDLCLVSVGIELNSTG